MTLKFLTILGIDQIDVLSPRLESTYFLNFEISHFQQLLLKKLMGHSNPIVRVKMPLKQPIGRSKILRND